MDFREKEGRRANWGRSTAVYSYAGQYGFQNFSWLTKAPALTVAAL
jgi:hypothetical protein